MVQTFTSYIPTDAKQFGCHERQTSFILAFFTGFMASTYEVRLLPRTPFCVNYWIFSNFLRNKAMQQKIRLLAIIGKQV